MKIRTGQKGKDIITPTVDYIGSYFRWLNNFGDNYQILIDWFKLAVSYPFQIRTFIIRMINLFNIIGEVLYIVHQFIVLSHKMSIKLIISV